MKTDQAYVNPDPFYQEIDPNPVWEKQTGRSNNMRAILRRIDQLSARINSYRVQGKKFNSYDTSEYDALTWLLKQYATFVVQNPNLDTKESKEWTEKMQILLTSEYVD